MRELINITASDLLDRLAQLEGEVWAAWERALPVDGGPTTYRGVLACHHRLGQHDREAREPHTYGNVLYGDGGWNRYFIKTDGSVWLSMYHVNGGDDRKLALAYQAEALGVGVFW